MLGNGYMGVGPEQGVYVKADEAYSYALDRCLNGSEKEEFKEMLVEWFYSGNWVPEEEED